MIDLEHCTQQQLAILYHLQQDVLDRLGQGQLLGDRLLEIDNAIASLGSFYRAKQLSKSTSAFEELSTSFEDE